MYYLVSLCVLCRAAIPGGMVAEGDIITRTLKGFFDEEIKGLPNQQDKETAKAVLTDETRRHLVYRGYMDDWRNTDNAWVESTAVVFLCTLEQGALLPFATPKGESVKIAWKPLENLQEKELFASHYSVLQRALAVVTPHLEKVKASGLH